MQPGRTKHIDWHLEWPYTVQQYGSCKCLVPFHVLVTI